MNRATTALIPAAPPISQQLVRFFFQGGSLDKMVNLGKCKSFARSGSISVTSGFDSGSVISFKEHRCHPIHFQYYKLTCCHFDKGLSTESTFTHNNITR
jgi:hypothetical protein